MILLYLGAFFLLFSFLLVVPALWPLLDASSARTEAELEALEKGDRDGAKPSALIDDLPLFRAAPAAPPPKQKTSEVEERLNAAHPDEMTPMEALKLLYELKGLLG